MTGSATEQHPRLPCSVLIIVHGRTTALMNVLIGLAAGTVWPTETVICFMNQPPLTDWPSLPFDLITCRVDGPPGQLPLAAARNRAAAQARRSRAAGSAKLCSGRFVGIRQSVFRSPFSWP